MGTQGNVEDGLEVVAVASADDALTLEEEEEEEEEEDTVARVAVYESDEQRRDH